jgi:hypothetical protein
MSWGCWENEGIGREGESDAQQIVTAFSAGCRPGGGLRGEGEIWEGYTDSPPISPGCLVWAIEGETSPVTALRQALEQGPAGVEHISCPLSCGQVLFVAVTMGRLTPLPGSIAHVPVRTVGVNGSVGKPPPRNLLPQVLARRYRTLKNEGILTCNRRAENPGRASASSTRTR